MAGIEWKRICCPVDFSEPSRVAMRVAAGLASKFGAELALLHAWTPPAYDLPEGGPLFTEEFTRKATARIDELLAAWKREAESVGAARVSTAIAHGVPFEEIVRFAADGRYDLIVMGTHGRTGLQHAIIGSVAERVVRVAKCPVLTIRPAG
jgi:nucleotide-binding universal stress UspA family protein